MPFKVVVLKENGFAQVKLLCFITLSKGTHIFSKNLDNTRNQRRITLKYPVLLVPNEQDSCACAYNQEKMCPVHLYC